MPLVIDTFNVLHVTGVLPPELAGIDVAGLAALIARSRHHRELALLVCDGAAPADPPRDLGPTISVRYAGGGRTADAVIIALISAATAPRQVTVVSSDREIQREARRRRCRVVGSEAFLRGVLHQARRQRPTSPRPSIPLAPQHVERWLRLFAVDLDQLEREAAAASDAATPPPPQPAPVPREPPPPAPRPYRHAADQPVLPQDLIREAEDLWEEE